MSILGLVLDIEELNNAALIADAGMFLVFNRYSESPFHVVNTIRNEYFDEVRNMHLHADDPIKQWADRNIGGQRFTDILENSECKSTQKIRVISKKHGMYYIVAYSRRDPRDHAISYGYFTRKKESGDFSQKDLVELGKIFINQQTVVGNLVQKAKRMTDKDHEDLCAYVAAGNVLQASKLRGVARDTMASRIRKIVKALDLDNALQAVAVKAVYDRI